MIDRFEQFSSSIFGISKYIQKIERDEMARYGLKGPHAQCLISVGRFPEGITVSRLCELCDKDKAAISRTVAELEQKNLIKRITVSDNRYRAPLLLTEEGKEVAENVCILVERAVELAGSGLDDDGRKIFYASLNLIAANLKNISQGGIPR